MRTPIVIDFDNVPEAKVSEGHQQNFGAILNDDNVVLVRGTFLGKWKTFIATLYDEQGEPVDMHKVTKIGGYEKIQVFPVAMLLEGDDLAQCLSATGDKIVFDKVELNQKPS